MSDEDKIISLDEATKTIDDESKEIVTELVQTDDPHKIQDLTALFNMANTKRNAIRIMRLGELWDAASSELLRRVSENPDAHANDDLVKYLSLAEGGMDRAAKTLGNVDVTPIIQINQQNNTLQFSDTEGLSRADRMKVLDVVNSILQQTKSNNIEVFDDTIETSQGDTLGDKE